MDVLHCISVIDLHKWHKKLNLSLETVTNVFIKIDGHLQDEGVLLPMGEVQF